MQETWVWSLIWKDPTCHGTDEPVCPNSRACALEPKTTAAEVWGPWSLCSTTRGAPTPWLESRPHSPWLEKALAGRRPGTAENKQVNKVKKKRMKKEGFAIILLCPVDHEPCLPLETCALEDTEARFRSRELGKLGDPFKSTTSELQSGD